MRWRSSEPQATASLRDSGTVLTLTRSGQLLGIEGLTAEERDAIAGALRSGRLPLGHAFAESARVLRSAGDQQSFRLEEPVQRRILSDRPTFRWERLDGASAYQVTVFTEDEKVLARQSVRGQAWRPETALPRGMRLAWQVMAERGKDRITAPASALPPAYFEIVSSETAKRLVEMARPGGSRMRLAVAYSREGLREEALETMNALLAENPQSAVAQQLRDSLLIK